MDLTDYAMFMTCYGQPAIGGCEPANLTGDEIIDLADLQTFVSQLAGPG